MLQVRAMTEADIALGMRLKGQAGWNQLEPDWRRALQLQPDGCFVAELDGMAAATTTTCIFGSVAWIALVLVDEALRGRGIGTALMNAALAFLDRVGVPSIRLDASPAGRPLYLKLGFVDEFPLARYDGVLPAASDSAPRTRPLQSGDRDAVLQLGHEITGTDRSKLLLHLLGEHSQHWRVAPETGPIAGFAAARPGALAWHLGPCLAGPSVGPLLLADLAERFAGQRVFLDVPLPNGTAIRQVETWGVRVQRPLFRMCRGPAPAEDPQRIWAAFGPEKG